MAKTPRQGGLIDRLGGNTETADPAPIEAEKPITPGGLRDQLRNMGAEEIATERPITPGGLRDQLRNMGAEETPPQQFKPGVDVEEADVQITRNDGDEDLGAPPEFLCKKTPTEEPVDKTFWSTGSKTVATAFLTLAFSAVTIDKAAGYVAQAQSAAAKLIPLFH